MASSPPGPVLVAGATGYVGRLLSKALIARVGEAGGPSLVRVLARHPAKAKDLEELGCEVTVGDVLKPRSIEQAMEGIETAYYLVHSMGRGGGSDFAKRDQRAASNFASAAESAGVKRIIYLGGLGDATASEHLRSRHETAKRLREDGVPVTYLRAAVILGSGSESFRTIYHLVKRLPVMVTPKWTSTRTQPIAIGDVIEYLLQAPLVPEAEDREIEIGGPQITTYGGLMDAMSDAMRRRRSTRVAVPFLTPWLSSLWIGLVTPVDPGVAQPLISGLSSETVVNDPTGMELFDIRPRSIARAMNEAVAELEA